VDGTVVSPGVPLGSVDIVERQALVMKPAGSKSSFGGQLSSGRRKFNNSRAVIVEKHNISFSEFEDLFTICG
jgi:hypothetical protein